MSNDQAQETKTLSDADTDALCDAWGKLMDDHDIKTGIVIMIHPKQDAPVVFFRGHFYDNAKIMSQVLERFKMQMASEINA